MKNVISQSHGLDLVNINVYATVYQNIPLSLRQSHWLHLVDINVYAKFHYNILYSSRDRAIFTFSESGARQSLDR